MSILKFSNIKKIAEVDYSSVNSYQNRMDFLIRCNISTFIKEMTKFTHGIEVKLVNLLETDPPLLNVLLNVGTHKFSKLDWIFKNISKRGLQDIVFKYPFNTPGEKFWDLAQKSPEALELLRKHGLVETPGEGRGIKRETFEWNGFSIVNAGVDEEILQDLLKRLNPVMDKIRKMGFGSVLYGPLVMVGSKMSGTVLDMRQDQYKNVEAAAHFDIQNDRVVITAENLRNFKILTHELAHRHYYKILSISQRQRWQSHFKDRGKFLTRKEISGLLDLMASCAPEKIDMNGNKFVAWDLFDYKKFDYRVYHSESNRYKTLEFMARYWVDLMKLDLVTMEEVGKAFVNDYLLEKDSFGGLSWAAKNLRIPVELKDDPSISERRKEVAVDRYQESFETVSEFEERIIRNWENKVIEPPHSTTEYGKNNPSEDYAEAFKSYIHNLEMPEDIMREFISINNIRMASKKAKISPEEKTKIDALMRKIDLEYKRKNYTEAERLDALLEQILEKTDTREEELETEVDDAEDTYGVKDLFHSPMDVDDSGAFYSLEGELAEMWRRWAHPVGAGEELQYEDSRAIEEYQRQNNGKIPPDESELWHSSKVFADHIYYFLHNEGDWHTDKPKPREQLTDEMLIDAAKDAYENRQSRIKRIKMK
ncbi:MAG: hypothetical protein WC511_02335 [Candidatus Pacearchaeota archaeon]